MKKIGFWLAAACVSAGVAAVASAATAPMIAGQVVRSIVADLTARPTVVVLPFENASGDAAQDFFADGMTDEIAAALVNVPALTVAGRASVYRFRTNRDLAAIGKTFSSDYFVEGSARKVDTRVRMSARLMHVGDAAPVWSEDYYSEAENLFDIQEDIARKVAAAMHVTVPAGEMLVRNRVADMTAYDQFLRAKPLIRARGAKAFADALVFLEDAVKRAPDFAPASAMLAFDYDLTPLYSPALRSANPEEARRVVVSAVPNAERLATHATELDPKNADGFVALAYANMVQGKLLQADELFAKALALNPNQSDGLHGYSQLLAAYGKIKESLAMRQHLQALEPFIVNYTADTAEIYWLDGQDALAIRMLNEFRPNRTSELAQVTASLGRYREAAGYLREMNAGNYLPGLLEAAARTLESAPTKTAPDALPRLGNLGFIYLHVGAPERVMEYYESNYAAGYFQPISSTWFWHPSYAPVRKLERFKNFAKNIGFVDVWKARGWPAACQPVNADDFTCQ